MSFSNNKNNNKGQQNQQSQQEQQPYSAQQALEEIPTLSFTQDEVVFIENVLVELEESLPNEMGENVELMDKIILAQRIIGARLDPEATEIGDSA